MLCFFANPAVNKSKVYNYTLQGYFLWAIWEVLIKIQQLFAGISRNLGVLAIPENLMY